MRSARLSLSLAFVLLMLALIALPAAGCTRTAMPPSEASGDEVPDLQAELQGKVQYVKDNTASLASSVHNMINEERKKEGLDPLQWDQTLANIAFSHSQDMATRDYFDHISPEGEDFADRYEEHNYRLNTKIGDTVYVGGENLSLINVVRSYTYDEETNEIYEYEYNDLEDLASSTVQGWMESPGHRDNILTPFTREGIGIFVTDEGEVYITEDFS
jgi:uncharacterized protein YkwD